MRILCYVLIAATLTGGRTESLQALGLIQEQLSSQARRAADTIREGHVLSLADDAATAPVLQAPARLAVDEMVLHEALSALHTSAGISLIFSPSFLPAKRVDCDCAQMSVRDALGHLLRDTDLEYVAHGNQIVIARRQAGGLAATLASALPVPTPFPGFETGETEPVILTAPPAAQEGTVAGQVVDALTGRPLANAQVHLPDLRQGVLTRSNGRYLLQQVPAGTHRLRAELIGYTPVTQEVEVRAEETTEVNFELSESPVALDEIVATVSAVESRRAELGTDFERFNAEAALQGAVINDFSDLLQGRMTGVSISESSGEAGTASLIRVRGATSLTQDNNPIIYVDGVRVSNQTGTGRGALGSSSGNGQTLSRLDDINPDDIASVQVVKGPTAAAIYGSEAAAGVILIETKEGVSGDHVFSFNVEQRFSQDVTAYPDNYYNLTSNAGITDPNDPRVQGWRPVQNPVTGEVFARDNPMENAHTEPFRTGRGAVYGLSVRGGQERLRYFTSLRYQAEDGVLPNNNVDRYSMRANLQTSPTENFDISVSTGFTQSDVRYNGTGRSPQSMLTNAMAGLPLFSYGTLEDGSRGECLGTVLFDLDPAQCELQQGNLRGSFEKIETVLNEQSVGRFIGSITSQYRPTPWLSNRLAIGIDHIQTKNYNLIPLDPDRPFRSLSRGTVSDERLTDRILTADFATTVSRSLTSTLRSTSTVGAQYFGSLSESVRCTGEGGFASTTAIACDAAVTFSGESDLVELVEIGAYAQQQLGYNDYLFGTVALRVDDNSAFGEQQGAIWSPSANASAVLSEMPFWNLDWMNSFRLRFAWGTAAQAPDPEAARRTFRPVRLERGGQILTGISPLDPGNADLTAERNEEFELGADAALLDNRISLSLTYFTQETRDAIVGTRVSPGTAFSGVKFVNIGAIENKGVEATLTARVLERRNATWDVGLKASTSDPVIASLGGQAPILLGAQVNGMFHEGYAPGSYYGPVVASAERAGDGSIIPESVQYLPGNLNIPGQPDYRYLGRPTPSNEQTLTTGVTLFGRLRLSTLFHRAGGYRKMDDTEGTRTPFIQNISGSRQFAFRQAESTPEDQWAMEQDLADAPQVFVSDADFIKWREVTVNYDVPPDLAQSLFRVVRTATVTLGARNLATWTDYTGFDPETRLGGGSDDFTNGVFFTMPAPRTFFLKLSTTF